VVLFFSSKMLQQGIEMIQLTGYQIKEEVYANDVICIYRADRHHDKQSVIIKTLKTDFPSPKALTQLRHEYELIKDLDLKGSVKPEQLLKYKNGLALILEDVGGESLHHILSRKKIDLLTFLKIGTQLAKAVDELHHHHIIHKDIKPDNVIANLKSGHVKITDFSISSQSQITVNSDNLEGTLAYMSPEQTGRVQRKVDYRTDLYSLGITLYEMLVGWLPFQTDDPMELVHCHIAKIPATPHSLNPEIPKILSDIVMKLLAKNPSERYQSAHGLKIDLQHCLQSFASYKAIDSFSLGQQDLTDSFKIPKKLYGRKEEYHQLVDIKSSLYQGENQLVMISGDEGMGKTGFVYELKQPVIQSHGFFISGKYEDQHTGHPLSAIFSATRDLILQLLTVPDQHIQQWQEVFIEQCADQLPHLYEAIPEMEMLIGKQFEQGTKNSLDYQKLSHAIQHFISLIASPSQPIVLFLDDIQWIDELSLDFLKILFDNNETQACLVIGGYRNANADAKENLAHSLEYLLNTYEALPVNFTHITLMPLKLPHIQQLLIDTLYCTPTHAHALAEVMRTKTAGNPFFIHAFLKTLHQKKIIFFDTDKKQWAWDIGQVLHMDMTDNVVSLMHTRMQHLPHTTQQILKFAACIGLEFDIDTLAYLYNKSDVITAGALWEAVEENLIIPLGDAYQSLYGVNEADESSNLDFVKASYRFVHQRIQQAAYTLVTEEEKQAIHYQLGRYLREKTQVGQLEEHLFSIVKHLNLGAQQITTDPEYYDLARLNLSAAKKMKLAGNYEETYHHLSTGLQLLPQTSWTRQYHLSLALHLQTLELEYLQGKKRQFEPLFNAILANANSLLDKIRPYEIQIFFLIAENKMHQALELGHDVLRQLEVTLPQQDNIPALFLSIKNLLNGRQVEQLNKLPVLQNPKKIAILRVLAGLSVPAYLTSPKLYAAFCFTQIKICLESGNSMMAANAYASYGVFLCGSLNDIDTGYRFGKLALNMVQHFDSKEYHARVLLLVYGLIKHWKEPARDTLAGLLKARQEGIKSGGVEYAAYSALYYGVYTFLVGDPLPKSIDRYHYALDLMNSLHRSSPLYTLELWQALSQRLNQHSIHPTLLAENKEQEALLFKKIEADKESNNLFVYHFAKSLLCYLFDDISAALEHTYAAHKYIQQTHEQACLHYPVHVFYHCLILLAHIPQCSTVERKPIYEQIQVLHKKLQYWARYTPSNYQHKSDLISAEIARLQGQVPQAMAAYEQAIAGAKKQNYTQDMAIANELAARFYQQMGIQKAANTYLIDAHYAYLNWGALSKVHALETQYSQLIYRHTDKISQHKTTTTDTTVTIKNQLDVMAVMKASQALSKELVLSDLIRKLLHIVVETSGAQKGLLILVRQEHLYLEAEVDTNDTTEVKLHEMSLDEYEGHQLLVPMNIINYVVRTKQQVNLSHATNIGLFTTDKYVVEKQPKSILCIPLLSKGQLQAIIYLENNLVNKAFNEERLTILDLLGNQMTISIENALFYARLEEARQVSESANKAKSSFLMNMSHELRTPLNAILGYADLIKEEAEEDGYDVVIPDLDKICTAGKQLLEIISNILDFSKIEADKMQLHVEVFTVPELVADVCAIIEPNLNGNQLHVECPETIGQMTADKTKTKQILLNLLSNAAKFTHNGEIYLTVSHHEQSHDEMVTHANWLRFTVEDTGIGMSEEQIKHAFDAFNQADNSTTRQYGGTGLGLSISNHFCRMMGGEIHVKSTLEQGSKFSIDLPSHVATGDDLNTSV